MTLTADPPAEMADKAPGRSTETSPQKAPVGAPVAAPMAASAAESNEDPEASREDGGHKEDGREEDRKEARESAARGESGSEEAEGSKTSESGLREALDAVEGQGERESQSAGESQSEELKHGDQKPGNSQDPENQTTAPEPGSARLETSGSTADGEAPIAADSQISAESSIQAPRAALINPLADPLADFDPCLPIDPNATFNIASLLTLAAGRHPGRLAAICRKRADCLGRTRITYGELERDSSIFAAALNRIGLLPGDRAIVMVPPGIDFFVVAFGLFKAGVVPVMVDPGMGLKRMLRCLAEGKPKGLVGVLRAHLASYIVPRYFLTLKKRVALGMAIRKGTLSLKAELSKAAVSGSAPAEPVLAPTKACDPAAVLFTSGATGPAKGAVYTHSMFLAQVGLIRDSFGISEGGVDLATFPLFSLFSAALGITAVIPNMNPVKPGSADPKKIVSAIEEEKATSLFASPALLSVLANHASETGLKLSTLTRVISAGAPVQPQLAASFESCLSSDARLLTPYGATEAMPLTSIDAKEIAVVRGMTEQGFGMCVGKPLPGHKIIIIAISDSKLDSIAQAKIMGVGEIGEIVAKGPVVSQAYFERPEETKMSLISGPDGQIWRRMGDLGWQDAQGRVWFCGRKSQRVVTSQGTFFTICCEAVFNNHPKVRRSALVGVGGSPRPVVVVETSSSVSKKAWPAMVEELKALARANPRTRTIKTFLKSGGFPVDVRHNAKISREKLAAWAEKILILPNDAK